MDLAGVSFIDSAGLRAIIRIQQRAAEQSAELTVIPPPAPLLELLEITGLTERLVLASDEARRRANGGTSSASTWSCRAIRAHRAWRVPSSGRL